MASKSIQSNSSSQMICKYDVFVSFRGEDTRNGFTDHLFAALQRKGIITFRDDQKLKKGETIAPELLQAIEGSRILIVVFSKNYASSTWCLQELTKIVDCIEVPGQSVLPVFYDVSPSEVRKQSGNFGKAFAEHEERFKEDLEMVQRWRRALTQVTNLAGWDAQNKRQHGEIEKIVEEVTGILGYQSLSYGDDFVGMHSPIEQLEKLLDLDLDLDLGSREVVRVVGICGMGGIGKTTLATVLYNKISHQYDACCFIDDVSKIYRDSGPTGLQKKFLSQALNEENLEITNLAQGTCLVRTRLCHIRALIVLDNVDQVEQLEKLAVNRKCVCAGSRIIIISRDEHILKEHEVDEVYSVQLLTNDKALQLFCKKAFKCDDIPRGYEELLYDALEYAKGLPLAIKVLGSFLFGLYVSEWKSALVALEENPSKDIMDVLRISFDGLGNMEKEIFLDIACFFNQHSQHNVKRVLDCCGFQLDIGMRVLIDKSLITISDGQVHMHDLLRELGRKIVREESPKEPGKWSRLWLYKDIYNVMLDNTATKNIEAIVMEKSTELRTLRAEALSKMSRLRLLMLREVSFSGSICGLSNELCYLKWHKYPFTYLPISFQPNKLVKLILPHSSLKQLWKGIKILPNLKTMDLSHSKNLLKLPDFSGVSNLQQLNFEECTKLVQINPSICLLRKLTSLNLKNCKNLVGMPNNIFGLTSLEDLNLSGCSKLVGNQILGRPRHAEHLKKLDTSETAMLSQSTSSIFKRLMLPFHFFNYKRDKYSIGCLLPSLASFPCLQDLDLSFCNLFQIPDAIAWLHNLETLNLGGNNFVSLPSSIKGLSRLISLNLEHCKQLKSLPRLPSRTILPLRREHRLTTLRAGLYIFNCPELGEIERCNSIAFSWMKQILQAHQESSASLELIDIVIPGSQIPRWFNNQCVDRSTNIDPSPILHDNNWIGFACYAAFLAHQAPTNLTNNRGSRIELSIGNKDRAIFAKIPVHLQKDLLTLESDHLWLVYFTRKHLINGLDWITKETHDFDGIKLEIKISPRRPQGLDIKVKNWGWHWVFKQDIKELKGIMTHGGSSNIQIHDGDRHSF